MDYICKVRWTVVMLNGKMNEIVSNTAKGILKSSQQQQTDCWSWRASCNVSQRVNWCSHQGEKLSEWMYSSTGWPQERKSTDPWEYCVQFSNTGCQSDRAKEAWVISVIFCSTLGNEFYNIPCFHSGGTVCWDQQQLNKSTRADNAWKHYNWYRPWDMVMI